MNTIGYLKEIYGYSTPIFLKDIRIGKKSKTAIRKELSRAAEKGDIVRDAHGVYYFDPGKDLPSPITFESVITYRFIKYDYGIPGLDLEIYGYYTGHTFLNQIGISQQVPAVIEITTNNTSCKRIFKYNGYRALLRKSKVKIDRTNYKILQFLDMFYLLDSLDVLKNKELLIDYIKNNLSKGDLHSYIELYPLKTLKLIIEGGLLNAFR